MKIKKAVIPVAGFGTRMLPLTKSMPKEMYPIVDRPSIEYIVKEAVDSGITDILIITTRGKELIEDYFDRSPELENALERGGKIRELDEVKKISELANLYFLRQKEARGLGDAILKAKNFVGSEPFAVLYGDDVMYSDNIPVCKQLINAYEEFDLGVVGAKKVPEKDIGKYGSLKVENIRDNLFMCTDMVEKPTPEKVMSLYSILGRCVLPPEIFEILEKTPCGVGGEIQLTDAMKVLAGENGMIAVDFDAVRYDMGNKLGVLKAIVETALRNKELKEDFKKYLLGITKKF